MGENRSQINNGRPLVLRKVCECQSHGLRRTREQLTPGERLATRAPIVLQLAKEAVLAA